MFPLSDNIRSYTWPIINYFLITLNIVVFIYQIMSPDFESFVYSYAFIPSQFNILDIGTYRNLITSIFLHGGWLHLASNVWFLRIFGDNVEDRMGHLKYLIFYLLGGIAATLGQYIFAVNSVIPMIGASGAIAAVAGAYFAWFKRSQIRTLVPIFFIWDIIELPAWFFLGYWFILQLFSGFGSLVAFQLHQGGVAWFAHIMGFVFGYYIARNKN